MLPAVEDLARRKEPSVEVLRRLCRNVLETTFANNRILSDEGELAEVGALVHTGDRDICRALVAAIAARAKEAILKDRAALSVLAALVGHLPPETLEPEDWDMLLTVCADQVKGLEGQPMGPNNSGAQASLELTAAVLSAAESVSGPSAAQAPDRDREDEGTSTAPRPADAAAPDLAAPVVAAGQRVQINPKKVNVASLRQQLKKLEERAKGEKWWRAEAAAQLAEQALAGVGERDGRFGDVVRRGRAAGRILLKLYSVGKIIAGGVSSMGATTVIDLLLWLRDLAGDDGEKGGALGAMRELWDDVCTVAGRGTQLQGREAWYGQARLLGLVAASGGMAELKGLLEGGEDAGEGALAACAACRPLALALASALFRVVEGPDGAQAKVAAEWLGKLAEQAVSAGGAGGADAAEVAAGALAHVACIDGIEGVAQVGAIALKRLAERGAAMQPLAGSVGCLAAFARRSEAAGERAAGALSCASELMEEVGLDDAARATKQAAGVATQLSETMQRVLDNKHVTVVLEALKALDRAPRSNARDRPMAKASTLPKFRRALHAIPQAKLELGINKYLKKVLAEHKEAVEESLKPVKSVHVHGTMKDLEKVDWLLQDLSKDLCGLAPHALLRGCKSSCTGKAFVLVAGAASVREAACLKALDEAIEAGRDVFQLYPDGARDALLRVPDGIDMRLSRFEQLETDSGRSRDPVEAFIGVVQRACRIPRPPAVGEHKVTPRYRWQQQQRAGESISQAQPPAGTPAWALAKSAPAASQSATRVFFCHAPDREDVAAVQQQMATLAELEAGVDCWSGIEHWQGGERWVDVVACAIHNCSHFVLALSPLLIRSQHCEEEFAYACSRDCAILVLQLRREGKEEDWIAKHLQRVAPERVQRVAASSDRAALARALNAGPRAAEGRAVVFERRAELCAPPSEANALRWTDSDVVAWARSQESLAPFAERLSLLNGRRLLSLTDSALQQLGFDRVAARWHLLSKIAALSKSSLAGCDRKKEVLCWNEEDVVEWVGSIGPLAQFAGLFSLVSGPMLLSMSDTDLERLGVTSFAARQRLLEKIAGLDPGPVPLSTPAEPAGSEAKSASDREGPEPAARVVDLDAHGALIHKYAEAQKAELSRDQDLALYVPPLSTADPKLPPDRHEPLHVKAEEFLSALRPRRLQPAAGDVVVNVNVEAKPAAGQRADANARPKRVLLLLGGAGTSKSTFLRSLQRDACGRWANPGDGAGAERLPVTVLVSLPQLAGMKGGVEGGLRQHVADKLGVPVEDLPALRDKFGLALLLDGYDEMGTTSGVNLWQANDVSVWADGAILTCRTEFLASLVKGKPPEDCFAPSGEDKSPGAKGLAQLHTVPFDTKQREEYLRRYSERHAGEEGAWTFERYAEALARTPGLADLAENPFSLSMLARVLPSEAEAGGRIRLRDLYRLFLRDWLLRELHRGNVNRQRDEQGWKSAEDAFVEEGTAFCKQLASVLFRMSASHASIPDVDPGKQKLSNPSLASEQRALSELLGDRRKLFVRNSCPLRRWRQGGSLGFAFVHKTLQEFLSAEALLESLPGGGDPSNVIDITLRTRSIVEESTLVRFLAEAVQREPQAVVANALVQIVKSSRPPDASGKAVEDEGPEVIAAANAATILVAGHYSLAGHDLQGVRIPRANLWRLEAAGANLQGADLRHCAIGEACLMGADLRKARMDGCRAMQWPALLHNSQVNAVAWTPDGKRIVSGSKDKSVRVWDAETGEKLLQLQGHTDEVTSVAVLADGKRIVSGSIDKSVRVWDAETGAELLQLQGHTSTVTSVAVSADGKRIVSGSHDNSVRVWDAETGETVLQLQGEGPTDRVSSVALSPDGKRIVSGSHDNSVWVLNAETGEESKLVQLQRKSGRDLFSSVAMSADGKWIVSGSHDNSVRVWNTETGAKLVELQGHKRWITSVAVSAGVGALTGARRRGAQDGKRIVSGSGNKAVRVWDAVTGETVLLLRGHTDAVTSVALSAVRMRKGEAGAGQPGGRADGKQIVSGSRDRSVRVWDAETGAELLQLQGHTEYVNSVAVSADGKRIVSGSHDNSVRVWNAEAGETLLQLQGHTDGVNSVAVSTDRRWIVSGGRDKSVRVWDVETGAELLQLQGHTDWVTSVAVSADRKRIVSGSLDNLVRVWDAETGETLLQLQGHTKMVFSVAVSADGKRVVSGSKDTSVRVWDAETGETLLNLEGHTEWVTSVAVSTDGKRIVSGSHDKSVRVWDAETGETLLLLEGHTDWVISVAVYMLADGKRIVSGSIDKSVRVWDAETGAELLQLQGHTYGVNSVAVSADGKRIVSGSHDNSVRVWDAETGAELLLLQGHADSITSVAVSAVREGGERGGVLGGPKNVQRASQRGWGRRGAAIGHRVLSATPNGARGERIAWP
eukprot:tig00000851_g4922.t1